jgi:hypothetical protein
MLRAAPPDPNGRRHENGDLTGRRLAGDEIAQYSGEGEGKRSCGITRNCTDLRNFSQPFWPKKDDLPGSFLPASPITVEGSSQRFRALCFVGQDKALARVP